MYNTHIIPSIKTTLQFKVIVNSFSDNINTSDEIINYLKKRKVIYERIDINQEMIMNTIERKMKNIKESYYREGNLAYIDSELSVPQLWINSLRLNYNQFKYLLETRLLDLIINQDSCEHIRFNQNENGYLELVHFREKFSHCLYCISERKLKPKIQIICDYRNSKNKEMNEILSLFESNPVSVEIFDYRNKKHYSKKVEEFIDSHFLSNSHSTIILYKGKKISLQTYDKYVSRNLCEECGKKINESSIPDVCIRCKTSLKINNTLSFIQKLRLGHISY